MAEQRKWQVLFLSKISPENIKKVEEVDPGIKVYTAKSVTEANDLLPKIDIVASLGWEFPKEAFVKAENLKWIHSLSAGVDALFYPEFLESDVLLTNSRGVYDVPVAEHAFALLTSLTRGIDRFYRFQMERVWKRSTITEMDGKVMGIIGLGSIGREIAKKAKLAYNMEVIATKKRVRGNEPNVDRILPADEVDELLRVSDFVVVATALTKETEGMIGADEFKTMKDTAYIVNIARGKVIQSKAILEALNKGWIAGAGLDVTDPEPLPSKDPLYEAPNLIITPHMGAQAPQDRHEQRTVQVFTKNLRAFMDNESMPTLVDRERRY